MAQKGKAVFAEVGGAQRAAPAKVRIGGHAGNRTAVRAWLLALFALVFAMILVGGLTRLTDSGLSITEWAPIRGAIPPMGAEAWQAEFDAYRRIPEYQLQNRGMSLAEFQFIYWWEWGHRQLGRVIGLVWAVGLAALLATRSVPAGWTGRLVLLGVLGGLQGAIGWWMVSSGLEGTMLDVASYRLAVHLGLAFVILGLIAWYALALSRPETALVSARRARERRAFGLATGWMHFTLLQVVIGAFVAGIDAGRVYADWPLMGGGIVPPTMWDLSPWWTNLTQNEGTVQWIHRTTGYLLLIFAVFAWRAGRASPNPRVAAAFHAALGMTVLQMVLGIAVVLLQAPWWAAILHQAGAVLLWVLVIRARHRAGYPPAISLRGSPARGARA